VLDAARRAGGIPVVYASSAAVYGDQPLLAHEQLRPEPRSAYGVDKLGSELHAAVAFRVHGVPTAGFRFFNVYGPRQDPASPYSGVVSIFAGRIARHQKLTIHGDGGQTRDFVFVGDVVHQLRAGMGHLRASPDALVLNVCTGLGTTVLELAHAIGLAIGRPVSFDFAAAREVDIRFSVGDPTLGRTVLGTCARTTLAEGLVSTLDATAAQTQAA
jgi:UDP-glucose 4-epimerase